MVFPTPIPSRQLDLGPAQYFEPIPEEPAGNQVQVREGWTKIYNAITQKALQTTVAFTPVSGAGKVRWDLVYINFSGNALVTAGAEQTSPVADFTGAPDPPAYSIPVAYVMVDETASVVVEDGDITDIRPQLNLLEDLDYSSGPEYALTSGEYYGLSLVNLDTEAELVKDFIGKDNKSQQYPKYAAKGSNEYAIADDETLAQAIANLDQEAERVKDFIGKDDISDDTPTYTSTNYISNGDPLEAAIGLLDAAIQSNIGSSGFVYWFLSDIPPVGYLEADGSELSMTTYENLYDRAGNRWGLDAGNSCTFDNVTDIVNASLHGLNDDDVIEFTNSGGALPTGLFADTKYFVVSSATNTFQVSLTRGGSAVDFSTNGTGTHKFHIKFVLPDIRGVFVRGWDHGRGKDSGRVFGTEQMASSIGQDQGRYGPHQWAHLGVINNHDGYHTSSSDEHDPVYNFPATTTVYWYFIRPHNIALLPCVKY